VTKPDKGEILGQEPKSSNDLAEDRTDLAEERTDWAEDRTVLANERTFAGWMRTGLAAVGIGLGFNALFGKLQPFWLPRAIASLFILIGIFIFYMAQRNGCRVQERLSSHDATPMPSANLKVTAGAMAFGSLCLGVGMWLIEVPDA
jgi:putative membrane protein